MPNRVRCTWRTSTAPETASRRSVALSTISAGRPAGEDPRVPHRTGRDRGAPQE
ncbi:hypothetical protein ACPA9J_36095 [Pseudomonas aeruginosa]